MNGVEPLAPPRNASEAELSWTFRLWMISPRWFTLGLAVYLVLAVLTWSVVGLWCALVDLILLAGVLSIRLIPYHYWLGASGVTTRILHSSVSHRWSEFRGFWVDGRKVRLRFKPHPLRDPLDLNTRDNLEQVIGYVQGHLPRTSLEAEKDV